MMKPIDFKVSLKVAAGPKQGQLIPLPRLPFSIGRGPDCQLRPGSDAIAPRHCVLQPGPGGLSICDLGSTTGTWVNGVRIATEIPVGDGDELKVGPLVFMIIVEMIRPPVHALPQTKTKLEISADRDTHDEMPVAVDKKKPVQSATATHAVK